MSSNSSPPFILLGLLLVVATSLISLAAATDHIVGANKGWNPGINYTHWATFNQTFYVNDYISFRYKKTVYNVFEVNKTGYDNCTIEGAVGNWSSGKDFIQFKKPGRYYFICGTGGCTLGMKVSVVVHPLPPPPSASITEHSSSSTKHSKSAAAELPSRQLYLVVFGGLLVGLMSSIFMYL